MGVVSKKSLFLGIVVSFFFYQNCSPLQGTGNGDFASLGGTAEYQRVQAIFNTSCVSCHAEPTSANKNVGLANYQAIIDSGVMIAGNSEGSVLYQVVDNGTMPQNLPALPIDELDAIRTWIDAGAPDEDGIPANEIPTINFGGDRSIVLPLGSTIDLEIVAVINDPDGNVLRTFWTQVDGPARPTLNGTMSQTLSIVDISVGGVYIFELLVEDDLGAIVREQVQVTVTSPNQAPNASVNPSNQTITMPTSTASITGSSNDPDGTIQSTRWSFVSGPTTPTISSPNNNTTNVTGLTGQGNYIFRYTATDDEGATDSANATVTVSSGTPPTIVTNNATAALGDASVQLDTTITDDGTVNTISWAQIAGPGGSTATIANGNTADPTISNFIQGDYTFRVSATDNLGNTSTADVDLMVTVSFANDVQPIMAAGGEGKCLNCHNNNNSVDVSSRNGLVNGDDVIAGNFAGSKVYQRITLPEADIQSMPRNMPVMSNNAIDIIRVWIDQGAPDN